MPQKTPEERLAICEAKMEAMETAMRLTAVVIARVPKQREELLDILGAYEHASRHSADHSATGDAIQDLRETIEACDGEYRGPKWAFLRKDRE